MGISLKEASALLRKIAKLRILVIGDVMLDRYVWGDATRISPEAPVPVIDVDRETWTAGGAGNVGLNIAALGARCTVVGYYGNDDAGRKLHATLASHHIRAVTTPGSGQTIVKTRVMVQHQQLCRIDRESPPAAYQFNPDVATKLFKKEIAAADAVILSDYAKGILTEELVERVSELARAAGKFVALDPKPRRPLKFRDLDLITPNKRESLQLAGIELPPHTPFPEAEVCARLHEIYRTRHLVITMGEGGMLLSEQGRISKRIPTAAREVFDVSGAGDTSLAALVLALAAKARLETAAHFANAAAGVVVGKLGTATVTPAELRAYVAHES
ncbi:MAG TPA: PfkB family carbohydrate kinase [Opitutaceae bacterium]|nr:PfkB family carbohydrate kinase [Opitutaceae bacterium]HND61814.1 PfkB family carbohydrate kinase [Opitutaceae bacterium]